LQSLYILILNLFPRHDVVICKLHHCKHTISNIYIYYIYSTLWRDSTPAYSESRQEAALSAFWMPSTLYGNPVMSATVSRAPSRRFPPSFRRYYPPVADRAVLAFFPGAARGRIASYRTPTRARAFCIDQTACALMSRINIVFTQQSAGVR